MERAASNDLASSVWKTEAHPSIPDPQMEVPMPTNKFGVQRKYDLLGMPFGTAAARLRKLVMFDLVKRCGKEIGTADELSIEHKEGWQLRPDPIAAFFDLRDIGFSHLLCNIRAGSRPTKIHADARAKRLHYERSPRVRAMKAIRNAQRDRRSKPTAELAEAGGFEPPVPLGTTG